MAYKHLMIQIVPCICCIGVVISFLGMLPKDIHLSVLLFYGVGNSSTIKSLVYVNFRVQSVYFTIVPKLDCEI